MSVASFVAGAAFHLSAVVSPFIDICRKLDSMLSNPDAKWATIILREESSGLWRDPHNVHQQPPMCFGQDLSSLELQDIPTQYFIVAHFGELNRTPISNFFNDIGSQPMHSEFAREFFELTIVLQY